MNPIISLIGIFLGLILLIVLAYKGHSTIPKMVSLVLSFVAGIIV